MRTVVLAVTLVLTLGVGLASAQSADEAAINARVEGLYAALAKGDAKAYAASWQENAVRALETDITVGRANIEKVIMEVFAEGPVEVKFSRHAVRLLSPTTAIVHGNTEDPSATPPTKGHVIFTLVKEGNEWLIAGLQRGNAPAE